MPKEKSLLENSVFNVIRTFSSLIFPIVTFAYASRVLGDVGIGRVSFTNSVISYFTMLATLGMRYYGAREAAKLRDDSEQFDLFVREMLIINAIMTMLSYALLVIVMITIPKFRGYETLLLISSTTIILQGIGMEWLYQAVEEYRYITIWSVVFQVASLGALFIFVRDPSDVTPYAIVHIMATSGYSIISFYKARKYVRFRRSEHYELKRHIKPLLWLFAMTLSIELYTVLDSTMLGFLQNDAAVGRYTAAVKVNKMVNSLITSVGVVLIPRLSYYIGQKRTEQVRQLVNKTYNFMFLLSVPAAVGLFMLSEDIILLFNGRGFMSALFTMRMLTPIVLIIPFSAITNLQIFVPMRKENLILQSTLLGAVINFTLNQLLIPKYAENGAAIATVLAEAAVMVVCYINLGKFFDRKAIFSNYYQYWIAAIPIPIVAVIGKQFPSNRWVNMCGVIGVSMLSYFSILLLQKNPYLQEAIYIIRKKVKRVI